MVYEGGADKDTTKILIPSSAAAQHAQQRSTARNTPIERGIQRYRERDTEKEDTAQLDMLSADGLMTRQGERTYASIAHSRMAEWAKGAITVSPQSPRQIFK
jgi:hypothetical protein